MFGPQLSSPCVQSKERVTVLVVSYTWEGSEAPGFEFILDFLMLDCMLGLKNCFIHGSCISLNKSLYCTKGRRLGFDKHSSMDSELKHHQGHFTVTHRYFYNHPDTVILPNRRTKHVVSDQKSRCAHALSETKLFCLKKYYDRDRHRKSK